MSNNVRDAIAAEVRAVMAHRRKTVRDLGAALGIVHSAASERMQANRSFKAEEIAVISGWLNVPVESLITPAIAAGAELTRTSVGA